MNLSPSSPRVAQPEDQEQLKLKLKEADLAIIVYDATDEKTWGNVEATWLPLVLNAFHGDQAKGILVVGTKADLLLQSEDREALRQRKCSDPALDSAVSRYLLSVSPPLLPPLPHDLSPHLPPPFLSAAHRRMATRWTRSSRLPRLW
jgi:hypothetical protein